MMREDFTATHGAARADMLAVENYALACDLVVCEANFARRSVAVEGTLGALAIAFGTTTLQTYRANDGSIFRGRIGLLSGPAPLDDRPQARASLRRAIRPAVAYAFPPGDGRGQTIALVELGGGYTQTDLDAYFAQLGIPAPNVTSIAVDGGTNAPAGDHPTAESKVLLDIGVTGAIAPGANVVVYFAPNTDRGFLDAITTKIHDAANRPQILPISWGGPEPRWTAQALAAFDAACADVAMLGVTVLCASGDNSSDGISDNAAHSANPGARIGPSVAGDADPQTGYAVLVDGIATVLGGTSAVAPLWAALIARINAALAQPIGFLNPTLYANPGVLRDIVDGNNGAYAARSGWDACTGLGSPTARGSPRSPRRLRRLDGGLRSARPCSNVRRLVFRAKEDAPRPDEHLLDRRSAAAARETRAMINVESVLTSDRAFRFRTIDRMRRHDATDYCSIGHHAYEIGPDGLPRLASERGPRRERMHAVEKQHFRPIDIPDTADDRLIHEKQTDRTTALDDLPIRQSDIGLRVEWIWSDTLTERAATIVVEDLDGDRTAQFEPNALGPHPQADDAADLWCRHVAAMKRSEAPEMYVQQTLVAKIVDEMFADRFDTAQRRAIEKRRHVFRAAAGSVEIDLVTCEFLCL